MAMSESRERKLAALTESLSAGDVASAQRALSEFVGEVVRPAAQEVAGPVALAEACGGVETSVVTSKGEGKYWLIRRTLKDALPEHAAISKEFVSVLAGARQRFDELAASAELCHVADAYPDQILMMDLETCGFSAAPVFLVGLMMCEGGELVFEQHFARHYGEEEAIVRAFVDRLPQTGVLVTFNGKAYDMAMIRERSAVHGIDLPIEGGPPDNRMPPHLDLLHDSRRCWKRQLPNCRLQTLEALICGRRRAGDIPGADIADAYHTFVHTDDARQIRDILHHNLLDLLTMAQLLCALLTGCEADEQG